MESYQRLYTPVEGKTYSLFADNGDSRQYYAEIKRLADSLLERYPGGERKLLEMVQKAGRHSLFGPWTASFAEGKMMRSIRETLKRSLSVYTAKVSEHLRTLPFSKRFDATLTTKERNYHLSMLEIELTNRIHREEFKHTEFKFALIAHCLRDFRPGCRAEQGDIDAVCRGCTVDCFVHLGGHLVEKYGIRPYISIERDQEKLFRKLKMEHPSIGGLGIACVPELASGMRLCVETGIVPLGVPLNANRCARWMSTAHETSFNLEYLEELLA